MAAPDARLSAQRSAIAGLLAQRLASGDAPLPELRDLQERLKLLDAALAEPGALTRRRIAALLWPLGLVGLLLLLAASVPVPSVPLSLSLTASSVQLDLSQAGQLGPLAINADLRIEGLSTLDSADGPLVAAAANERPDSLSLRSTQSRLRALRWPAGASLGLEVRPDATALMLESPRGPLIAELELRGPTTLLLGDAAEALVRDYGYGEWLRLIAGNAAQPAQVPPPLALTMARRNDAPLRLAGLHPARLRFVERREGAVGDSALGSGLLGATLTLPATGQTMVLAAGDWLELDGLRLERFEIVAGAPLRIELNGSARGLRQRVGEFERSLKPSWLEYLSRHHLVQLLWGSAAALWGALAWLRYQFAALAS